MYKKNTVERRSSYCLPICQAPLVFFTLLILTTPVLQVSNYYSGESVKIVDQRQTPGQI